MKKLMIAAAIVCAAAMSQAAAFAWSSNDKVYGLVASSVTGNGTFSSLSSQSADRGDKGLALTYVLSIYDGSGLVGTDSGAVKYGSLGKPGTTMNVAEAEQGKDYTYTLVISGTQSSLTARGVDGDKDYSNATISWTYNGNVTTPTGGAGVLASVVPTSWTVSGVKDVGPGPTPPPIVPEPTSGLLLLLGVAGLALRRRRA